MSSRPRILIAEDEELISEMLSDELSIDYEVVCVDNVAQALSALRSQRFDVILLDAHLRNETGQDIGEYANRTEVPLIWMTGDPHALVVDAGIVLPKPFDLRQLPDVMAKARGLF